MDDHGYLLASPLRLANHLQLEWLLRARRRRPARSVADSGHPWSAPTASRGAIPTSCEWCLGGELGWFLRRVCLLPPMARCRPWSSSSLLALTAGAADNNHWHEVGARSAAKTHHYFAKQRRRMWGGWQAYAFLHGCRLSRLRFVGSTSEA